MPNDPERTPKLEEDSIETEFVGTLDPKASFDTLAGGENTQDSDQHYQKNIRS